MALGSWAKHHLGVGGDTAWSDQLYRSKSSSSGFRNYDTRTTTQLNSTAIKGLRSVQLKLYKTWSTSEPPGP